MKRTSRPSVTIKVIANRIGVSHSTVSRALNDHPAINDQTKQQVREAAARLGYVRNSGARTMRSGTSRLVGLVVPDIQNEFYNAAARAMAERCAKLGYQMLLGVSEDDPAREEQNVRAIRESCAAGVLFTPSCEPTPQTLALVRQLPTVQFLRFDRRVGSIRVVVDDFEGIYRATEHLVQLGHQRIAYIGRGTEVSTGAQRISGYHGALRKKGIRADPALQRLGPTRPDFGAAALSSMIDGPTKPTAVVVGSSRQLLGVLKSLRARGIKVPEMLSVIAYGDADWMQIAEPPVTAISLPVQPMGERATDVLFELSKGSGRTPRANPVDVFPTELILRGSTGPANDAQHVRIARRARSQDTHRIVRIASRG